MLSVCAIIAYRALLSRNADGRLRMASSASPRRNRSRRASLSSDMSSSSSSDTDGSVSVVLGPVGDEQSSEKQKKTTEKHRHTNGGGRWGSDTASPDLPLPLHRPGSSETKSLRVQALLAGQTDYIQANRRPPPSSPSLNLQVKTTSNSVNMHNAEVRRGTKLKRSCHVGVCSLYVHSSIFPFCVPAAPDSASQQSRRMEIVFA